VLCRRVAKPSPDVTHLVDRIVDPAVHARGGLEHRRHQLLTDAVVVRGVRHLVEPGHELVALRGDELELLLDSEAEWCAAAEGVFHAGDRSDRVGRYRGLPAGERSS
jgi:hypothetical protein